MKLFATLLLCLGAAGASTAPRSPPVVIDYRSPETHSPPHPSLHARTVGTERAVGATAPPGLRFEVAEAVTRDGRYLRLEGRLVNEGARAARIVVWPASGYFPFHVELPPDTGVKRRPHPGPPLPTAPPPHEELEIPGRATVRFVAVLDPDDYEYAGAPTVEAQWRFELAGSPTDLTGRIRVTLPAR